MVTDQCGPRMGVIVDVRVIGVQEISTEPREEFQQLADSKDGAPEFLSEFRAVRCDPMDPIAGSTHSKSPLRWRKRRPTWLSFGGHRGNTRMVGTVDWSELRSSYLLRKRSIYCLVDQQMISFNHHQLLDH